MLQTILGRRRLVTFGMKGVKTYPLNSIYFYLTEACNLRCRHCWLAPAHVSESPGSSFLDVQLLTHVIEQSKTLNVGSVKLTGGEPLIHHNICQILDYLKKAELAVNIETNGVALTAGLARAITQCKQVTVSVSLDGVDSQTHEWVRRVKGSFNSAVKGVKRLVEAGVNPQIIMSINRGNKDQMAAMVNLAQSLGASSVKFNIVQPASRGEEMRDSGETLSVPELIELGQWVERELAPYSNPGIVFSHPPAFRPLGSIFRYGNSACETCRILNIIGVISDGSYALCGIGQKIEELIFGHASEITLRDVWEQSSVLNDLRTNLPDGLTGVCSGCLMKRSCLGNCIALNYYQSKSLYAPFWYCGEAEKLGLFPKTRLISTYDPTRGLKG
jgi:SynChlorMet cassette radical SAM/SPASM protein ScmF